MRHLGRHASEAELPGHGVDRTLTASPRIAVATPHQEASMLAIARAGARNGHLARMYTTLHTARLEAAAPKLPHRGLRRVVEGQLARRSFAGIPSDVVEPVAQVPQAFHALSMRIPRAHSLASWLLYDSKKRFDRAVSRRIVAERFDAVVTLDFSTARTFQVLHDEATLRVLDFIDSHPRYQNR